VPSRARSAEPITGKGQMSRIHIVGASGSGTSTLGAALAKRPACAHVDADTLFWLPTDPPFVEQRPREARQALLVQALPADGRWIFAGSATGGWVRSNRWST
jgi:hypothetical protein